MSELVNLNARKMADLITPTNIGVDYTLFKDVKIPAGAMPDGFNSFEGLTLDQIIKILANESQKYFTPLQVAEFQSLINNFFNQLQLEADTLVAQGFYKGYATEVLLLASKPNIPELRAKADDTQKIWRWNRTSVEGVTPITGTWTDTGLSEKDQALEVSISSTTNLFKAQHLTLIPPIEIKDISYSYEVDENSLPYLSVVSSSSDTLKYLLYGFEVDESVESVSAYVKVDLIDNIENLAVHCQSETNTTLKTIFAKKKDGLAYVAAEKVPLGTKRILYSIRIKKEVAVKIFDLFLCFGSYIQPEFTLQHENKNIISGDFAENMFDESRADFLRYSPIYTSHESNGVIIHEAKSTGGQLAGIGFSRTIVPDSATRVSASVKIPRSSGAGILLLLFRENEQSPSTLGSVNLIPVYRGEDWTKYEISNVEIPAGTGHIRLFIEQASTASDLLVVQPYLSFSTNSNYFPAILSKSLQNVNDLSADFVGGISPPDFIDVGITYQKDFLTANTILHVVTNNTGDSTIGVGSRTDRGNNDSEKISASVKFKKGATMPTQVALSMWSASGFISRIQLQKSDEDSFILYVIKEALIPANCIFCRLYITIPGGTTVEFYDPFVSWLGGASDFALPIVTETAAAEIDVSPIKDFVYEYASRQSNPFLMASIDLINGQIIDRNFDPLYFSCWGSSTIHDMHAELEVFARSIGCTNFYAGGKGGEVISHHSARMGARKAHIKFPSGYIVDGAQEVLHDLNMTMLDWSLPYTCVINGVVGTLGYNAGFASRLAFTRAVNGVDVYAPLTYDAIPSYDQKFRDGFVIINAGKNDAVLDPNANADDVFNRTVEMVEHCRSAFSRCLVLGQFYDMHYDQSDNRRQLLETLNRRLEDAFGHRFIDVQGYLMSDQVWLDTGLTKTTADEENISRGKLPPSLSDGGVNHMGPVTQQAVVDHLLRPRMQALGWI